MTGALTNEQAIKGAHYGTYDMGMTFEPVQEGEVYMICQGSGAGYGDVLERDPQLVIKAFVEDPLAHLRAEDWEGEEETTGLKLLLPEMAKLYVKTGNKDLLQSSRAGVMFGVLPLPSGLAAPASHFAV